MFIEWDNRYKHPPDIKILPHFVIKSWTYPHTPTSKLLSQVYRIIQIMTDTI